MIPTILVPGITGTNLINTNTLDFDVLFSNFQKRYETIDSLALQLDADLDEDTSAIIERGAVERFAYEHFVKMVRNEMHEPIFIFGYDWRFSAVKNGKALLKYTEHIMRKMNCDKINFVTHSLGGIIFQCFLTELKGNYNCINKAVLTVPPFEGSIEALKKIIVGESCWLNTAAQFRKLARTFPSMYELLPVYKNAVQDQPDFDIFEPKNWQSNMLETYTGEDKADKKMFLDRLAKAKQFRNSTKVMDLAMLPKNIRERILILVGDSEKTANQISIEAHDSQNRVTNFFNFEPENADMLNGDGVVSLHSSTVYQNNILTLAVARSSIFYNVMNFALVQKLGYHAMFLTESNVNTITKRFFQDRTDNPDWYKTINNNTRKIGNIIA
jgi:hypothetical protein